MQNLEPFTVHAKLTTQTAATTKAPPLPSPMTSTSTTSSSPIDDLVSEAFSATRSAAAADANNGILNNVENGDNEAGAAEEMEETTSPITATPPAVEIPTEASPTTTVSVDRTAKKVPEPIAFPKDLFPYFKTTPDAVQSNPEIREPDVKDLAGKVGKNLPSSTQNSVTVGALTSTEPQTIVKQRKEENIGPLFKAPNPIEPQTIVKQRKEENIGPLFKAPNYTVAPGSPVGKNPNQRRFNSLLDLSMRRGGVRQQTDLS